jgi:hypothetical protein
MSKRARPLAVAVLVALIGVTVVPRPTAAFCDPGYHTCEIRHTDVIIPGWYPIAEGVAIYAVYAGTAYLLGRFTRIKPPWQVVHGGGAAWSAIDRAFIESRFRANDRVVQRNYEGPSHFQSTMWHYRGGSLYATSNRSIAKSSCQQVNNLIRALLNGTWYPVPGTRFTISC